MKRFYVRLQFSSKTADGSELKTADSRWQMADCRKQRNEVSHTCSPPRTSADLRDLRGKKTLLADEMSDDGAGRRGEIQPATDDGDVAQGRFIEASQTTLTRLERE